MSLSPSSKRRRLLPLPPWEGLEKDMDVQNNLSLSIPSLSEDIVREILVRIPAKTLIRFMCVCKSWFRLISDPDFAKLHFNRSLAAPTHRVLYKPPTLGFKYNQIHASPRSVDIDAPFCHELTVPFPNFDCKLSQTRSPFRVYGVCNGCILLLSRCCSNNLTLWNPLTRTYKVLPLSPNGSKFRHVSGLGYDEATNDFLVVLTSFTKLPAGADIACYLEIFSVRKNSWEVMVLQHPFSCKWETFTYRSWGLFFNGVIHWSVPDAKVILCFDLRLRRLSEMITPNENHRLMVVGGSLASHDRTKVWVMKEYNVQSSWTVYCDVKTNHYPICFNNDGKMIALLNPARNGEKLVKLNDKGYQLDIRDSCYDSHHFGRVVYRESLFSFSSQIRSKDNRSELCSNPIRSREGTTDKPSKDQFRPSKHPFKCQFGPSKHPFKYQFCPSDEEVMDLLIKRLKNPAFMRSCVFDGDVHAQDPKDIFPNASHRYGFFYSHLPMLYPNTTHVNRLTPSGEWMLSNGVPIKKNDKVIGFKSIFWWHEGDLLTNWTMEEYQLSSAAILKLTGKLKNEETMKKIQQLVVCKVEEGAQIIK